MPSKPAFDLKNLARHGRKGSKIRNSVIEYEPSATVSTAADTTLPMDEDEEISLMLRS